MSLPKGQRHVNHPPIDHPNKCHDINATKTPLGQRHVNHPPIDHPYECHGNTKPFTCSTPLQGPYPYQKMKVRSQPVANITKKHGGMHSS